MKERDTEPTLRQHIVQALQRWVADLPGPRPRTSHQALSKALQAQADLGGWNLLLGRVSRQITAHQHTHYRFKRSRRSGFRWTVEIIKKLQNVAWQMWQYRNGVLHDTPDRHHQRDLLEEVHGRIAAEWATGTQGLLYQDRFLFRSQEAVMDKTLPQKQVWLTTVALARQAAARDQANKDIYASERRGMQAWLQTSNTRPRDGL
jgi:hypothetical protein